MPDTPSLTEPVGPTGSTYSETGHEWHLSVSAAPCASRRLNTQRARLYDRLRSTVLQLPRESETAVFLHVRDTSSLLVGHDADALLVIAETLADVQRDLPVSYVHGPFIDAALMENLPLLEHLPELLSISERLCPTVQLSTLDNGLSEHTLEAVCLGLAVTAQKGTGTGSRPVIVSAHDCDRRAFGHRVHAEAIVAHHRHPAHGIGSGAGAGSVGPIPEDWQRVEMVDLPLLMHHVPQRTSDHITVLGSGDTPATLLSLLESGLLAGTPGGARRQLMLLC